MDPKIFAVLSFPLLAVASAEGPLRTAVAILPSGKEVVLEVAADPVSRQRGLMFRERLEPAHGMLFAFEKADRHPFWMKNCRIPLDIVWLDEDLRVVDVAPELAPCPAKGPCPEHVPLRPARFVIELAAGTARAEGVRLGERVIVLGEAPSP